MRNLVCSVLLLCSLLSVANATEAKGLNVVLTSKVPQTQMMAMVLSMKTLKQKKMVNIVLCSDAGDLALKKSESPILKPINKSPKMLLKALLKKGANVQVCPLYLPNKNLDKTALINKISVANPMAVSKQLLDLGFSTLSY